MSSSRLVYVHGTNGSGKSTLARAVIAAAGGVTGVSCIVGAPKATWTHTGAAGVVLVGKYGNACGGVDGLAPYASIKDIVANNAGFGRSIMAEGLITPGVETCQHLADTVDEALFIFLDVPVERCITNVLSRRARKGTTKDYDPANLLKKRQSAESWEKRLSAAGLKTQILNWSEAYFVCLEFLGLPVPDVDQLL
ncbi:MAG: hypothetical protein JZU64_00580 [Rhodoferax sp.]|nr:hypothetical protein [Rhodoferax sp.]